jgi:nucleotide-binding universal stress UspA family protein
MPVERLRKLGVYLNDEPGDKEALAFAGLLTALGKPDLVDCIHVRGLEDPVQAPAPDPETVHRQLIEVLPADLANSIEIHVHESTGLQEMLRTARDHDLDMIVVGRRPPSDQLGLGSAFYRLARKTPCDVLVVPEHAHAHLGRLLVLVDGSEHSRMALETALYISRASGGKPQVVVQSVYGVAYGYRYEGMTLEQAGRHREALQRKKIEEFLAGVDTSGVDFEVVYTCSLDIAAAAYDLAAAKNMDAIVIGSRGATLPAIALLGGTTERVLLNAPVPVLLVKRKGETFGFLNAVLAQFQEPG